MPIPAYAVSEITTRDGRNVFQCNTCLKTFPIRLAALGHYNIVHLHVRPPTQTRPQIPEDTISLPVLSGRWDFMGAGTDVDYTSYLRTVLSVGLELELDFKNDRVIDADRLESVFGVHGTSYHSVPPCPVCHSGDCWTHLPKNLIRAIERDGSIHGWEFIIYGSTIESEEFAKRLPIDDLARFFQVTESDSMHLHLLLKNQVMNIPTIIIKNFWQLFRYFYPAWVYLFGNTNRTYLRNSHYSPFQNALVSPIGERFDDILGGLGTRSGVYLSHTTFINNNTEVSKLDVEIRTSDSSLNIEQIVLARALAKALFVRAAQLSNYGVISVDTDHNLWYQIKATIQALNAHLANGEVIDEEFLKNHTKLLLSEVAHLLSPYEKSCFKSLMDNPVRNTLNFSSRLPLQKHLTPLAQSVKRAIIGFYTQTSTKAEWVTKTATALSATEADLLAALDELGAFWDEDSRAMMVK